MLKIFKLQTILLLSLLLTPIVAGLPKNDSMNSEIRSESWVLPLPEGYSASLNNGIYEISKENSTGALQLSSKVKTSNWNAEELQDIARKTLDKRAELRSKNKNDILGYNAMFREGPVVWIYWFFAIERSFVLITYNVDGTMYSQDEALEIFKIVDELSRVQ